MDTTRTVALLRAVNVGGRNKVPMAALRAHMAGAGFTDVATLLASGNVFFREHPPDPANALSQVISEHFGCTVPVVLRTADQLATSIARCPFPAADCDPKLLHVGFCSSLPDPAAVAALDPDRSPPDRFVVVGDTIYVRYATGSARSKLSVAWFDRQLGCTTTFRNWRTLGKIHTKATA